MGYAVHVLMCGHKGERSTSSFTRILHPGVIWLVHGLQHDYTGMCITLTLCDLTLYCLSHMYTKLINTMPDDALAISHQGIIKHDNEFMGFCNAYDTFVFPM